MRSAGEVRALVVDDEPVVRRGIRTLLERAPGIHVVGEARNGVEALEHIWELSPDLLFLDVQMPVLDGWGVVEALKDGELPAIVFVTAYDVHAVRAFEINAVDYLLKPFDENRFGLALERARHRLDAETPEGRRAGIDLAVERYRADRPADRVLVRVGQRLHFVSLADVEWIGAADNYVRLHTSDQWHPVRETMDRLERRLAPAGFARIHRSTMVNLARVAEIRPLGTGDYQVRLAGGTTVTMSRTYWKAFAERYRRV